MRLTRRGRLAVGALALTLLGSLVLVIGWWRTTPACTVRVGSESVSLSTAEAVRDTELVAEAVRAGAGPGAAEKALRQHHGDDEAALLAKALTGRVPHALTCRHGGGDPGPKALDSRGLTRRAAAVRTDLLSTYGKLPLGGYAPGGVHEGHMPGSAHYEGRAIDVFFRPATSAAQHRRGWAVAEYLVAHAEQLKIATVIYDKQIWTARRSFQGWRDYTPYTSNRNPSIQLVLEHRDHVHVDVP